MSEQDAPTPVRCDSCGKPLAIPPAWMARPRADNEPETPIRIALCGECDRPGIGSQIMMARMQDAGLLWPPPADAAA